MPPKINRENEFVTVKGSPIYANRYNPDGSVSNKQLSQYYSISNTSIPVEILNTGNIDVINGYLKEGRLDPNSKDYKHLEERIEVMKYLNELEVANNEKEPVPIGPMKKFDNGMNLLPGMTLDRSQTSPNGCWSCAFSLLLKSRGVDVSQELIRRYRPEFMEGLGPKAPEQTDAMNGDVYSEIFQYSELVGKLCPNTLVKKQTVGYGFGTAEQAKNNLIDSLRNKNTPVAVCKNNHWRTVVGISDDNKTVYIADSLQKPGTIVEESIDTLTSGRLDMVWTESMVIDPATKQPVINNPNIIFSPRSGGNLAPLETVYTVDNQTKGIFDREENIEVYYPGMVRDFSIDYKTQKATNEAFRKGSLLDEEKETLSSKFKETKPYTYMSDFSFDKVGAALEEEVRIDLNNARRNTLKGLKGSAKIYTDEAIDRMTDDELEMVFTGRGRNIGNQGDYGFPQDDIAKATEASLKLNYKETQEDIDLKLALAQSAKEYEEQQKQKKIEEDLKKANEEAAKKKMSASIDNKDIDGDSMDLETVMASINASQKEQEEKIGPAGEKKNVPVGVENNDPYKMQDDGEIPEVMDLSKSQVSGFEKMTKPADKPAERTEAQIFKAVADRFKEYREEVEEDIRKEEEKLKAVQEKIKNQKKQTGKKKEEKKEEAQEVKSEDVVEESLDFKLEDIAEKSQDTVSEEKEEELVDFDPKDIAEDPQEKESEEKVEEKPPVVKSEEIDEEPVDFDPKEFKEEHVDIDPEKLDKELEDFNPKDIEEEFADLDPKKMDEFVDSDSQEIGGQPQEKEPEVVDTEELAAQEEIYRKFDKRLDDIEANSALSPQLKGLETSVLEAQLTLSAAFNGAGGKINEDCIEAGARLMTLVTLTKVCNMEGTDKEMVDSLLDPDNIERCVQDMLIKRPDEETSYAERVTQTLCGNEKNHVLTLENKDIFKAMITDLREKNKPEMSSQLGKQKQENWRSKDDLDREEPKIEIPKLKRSKTMINNPGI